jgi:hypothetical protein
MGAEGNAVSVFDMLNIDRFERLLAEKPVRHGALYDIAVFFTNEKDEAAATDFIR